jgi:signal transduction histidine kinase
MSRRDRARVATPVNEPAAGSDRERRARLANMRQELLAPVMALVGYGELLGEEAERLDWSSRAPDLERILAAAQDLLTLVASGRTCSIASR